MMSRRASAGSVIPRCLAASLSAPSARCASSSDRLAGEADAVRGYDPRLLGRAARGPQIAHAAGLEVRPGLFEALCAERTIIEAVAFAGMDRRFGDDLAGTWHDGQAA